MNDKNPIRLPRQDLIEALKVPVLSCFQKDRKENYPRFINIKAVEIGAFHMDDF